CNSSLHRCFSSNQVELGKLSDFKWPCQRCIRFTEASITSTVSTQLPETGEDDPADSTRGDYEICSSGKLTGTDIVRHFTGELGSGGIHYARSIRIILKESKNG